MGDYCDYCATPIDEPFGDEPHAMVLAGYENPRYEETLVGVYCADACRLRDEANCPKPDAHFSDGSVIDNGGAA